MSDLANARRFASEHRGQVLYVPEDEAWRVLDPETVSWQPDTDGAMLRLAATTADRISDLGDDTRAARRATSLAGLRDMLALAGTLEGMHARRASFEPGPWILDVQNGRLDLATMTFRPRTPDDRASRVLSVPWDPQATAPAWERFILDSQDGDERRAEYLQRLAGLALTGHRERRFWLLHGPPATGKSTYLEVLRALLGPLAQSVPVEAVVAKRHVGNGPSPDLVRLEGIRLATASETEEGHRLAIALLKTLSGADTIAARGLYQATYREYMPVAKLIIATNSLPKLPSADQAIWERATVIPFRRQVPEEQRLPRSAFLAELPGVLNWAIAGTMLYRETGLPEPWAVTEAGITYRREQDPVMGWLAECTEQGPGHKATATELYSSYQRYAMSRGEHPMTHRAFGAALKEHGLKSKRTNQHVAWLGIHLRV